MPDYYEKIFPNLKISKNALLTNHSDIILPNYNGYCLGNIPASISSWLGGPKIGCQPLASPIMQLLNDDYDRVLLIVVDALGYYHFQRLMNSGKADVWKRNLSEAKLFPITSICPSTTASALTTIWTGVCPNQHGYIGYEMWLKEYSMVINTILHNPTSFIGEIGSLQKTGFVPSDFLDLPTLGTLFTEEGIESHAFLPSSILNSGLSQMHLANSILHGYVADSDLWINVRNNINSRPIKKKFCYVYWSTLDTLIHRYGPDDERVDNQFAEFSRSLEENFFEGLENWAKKRTLLILTADHGAITTPINDNYILKGHPGFVSLLRMLPTCENRLPFLYIKQDAEPAAREYIEKSWPGKFSVITADEALRMRLFGIGDDHIGLSDRIGDLILIPHEDAYLWWPTKANVMQGRHGGLSPNEMIIPLYALSMG